MNDATFACTTMIPPETLYARAKAAGWVLTLLPRSPSLDDNFLHFFQWITGSLKGSLKKMETEVRALQRKKDLVKARTEFLELLTNQESMLPSWTEELLEKHPCLKNLFIKLVRDECQAVHNLYASNSGIYTTASSRLKQTFGLNESCRTFCEFLFINQTFQPVESYIDDDLELFRYANRRILADLLGMSQETLQTCIDDLSIYGLIERYGVSLRLNECLLSFWSVGNVECTTLFARPLAGEALVPEVFHLPEGDIAHIRRLLEQDSAAPVHLLLYGPPGTGKTAFVRSIAKSCGLKVWTVTSRTKDDDDVRRISLTCCLHLASRTPKTVVLVDEAERLLDTDLHWGARTKDKAWLNTLLEESGRRVIWITNQVEHIDPAVRRRFSFSIHFAPLGLQERQEVWRQILTAQGVAGRLSEEEIDRLAADYPVEAAIIQNAVSQARNLYEESSAFFTALTSILRAQLTLQHDGKTPFLQPHATRDFIQAGVSLEGGCTGLLEKCRRLDAAMRGTMPIRPGCGTMLFYGPPGTGKTALARHIADSLNRTCLRQRASDLLHPLAGMSEQHIAEAFARAEREGAVLIIDEVDSFLFTRDASRRSWENSLVNEFLTALEECRCFCICTTNRRLDLDTAVIRRFAHKLAFTYASQTQIRALYARLLAPLCAETLTNREEARLLRLERLTPGDFHTVRCRYDPLFTDRTTISHTLLIDALASEVALKLEHTTPPIGFSRRTGAEGGLAGRM